MEDLKKFIATTIREFLNESLNPPLNLIQRNEQKILKEKEGGIIKS